MNAVLSQNPTYPIAGGVFVQAQDMSFSRKKGGLQDSFSNFIESLFSSSKKRRGLNFVVSDFLVTKTYYRSSTASSSLFSVMPYIASVTVDLDKEIEMVNPEAIEKFESIYPDVITYIKKTQRSIQKYLPDSSLALEVVTDPDSDTGFEEAFLYIKTRKQIVHSLVILNEIYAEVFAGSKGDRSIFNIRIEQI